MTRVDVRYQDGRTITWEDGQLRGDRVLLGYMERPPEPTGKVTPEGPVLKLDTYRRDPWAFVASAQLVHPVDHAPKFAMHDMPQL